MIKINRLKPFLFCLALTAFQPQFIFAQEYEDALRRIRYLEKTEVKFWLTDETNLNCLNAGELAQYTGSTRMVEMIETIDTEGDLLTDETVIFERNVRDDWMTGYRRIVVGKDHVEILDDSGEVITSEDREPEHFDLFDPEQAEQYMRYQLDEEFLHQLQMDLEQEGYEIDDFGGRLKARLRNHMVSYNPELKVFASMQYDSLGVKTREKAIEFELTEDGYFFPAKDTEIEWIMSDSGCCVKKMTMISRFDVREHIPTPEQPGSSVESAGDKPDYEIKVKKDFSSFTVESRRFRLKPFETVVYDLEGTKVLHTKIKEGQPVPLPSHIRGGMYLVHVISADRHTPVVGKIIKPNSGTSL